MRLRLQEQVALAVCSKDEHCQELPQSGWTIGVTLGALKIMWTGLGVVH